MANFFSCFKVLFLHSAELQKHMKEAAVMVLLWLSIKFSTFVTGVKMLKCVLAYVT